MRHSFAQPLGLLLAEVRNDRDGAAPKHFFGHRPHQHVLDFGTALEPHHDQIDVFLGCGCILLLNKWDLVEKDSLTTRRYVEELRGASRFLQFAPAMTISAKTGLRVPRIFELVEAVYAQYTTRLGTGQLNRIMERALQANEPPMHRGHRLKFYYTTQVGTKPPTFVSFVNYPDAVHFSYKRYIINQIREGAGLDQTPLRLIFRQRSGPLKDLVASRARRPQPRKGRTKRKG